MNNDFKKYATRHLNMNGNALDKYIDVIKENKIQCILLTQNNFKDRTEKPLCVINKLNY